MKKLYSLGFLFLVGMLCFSARAISFTFKVNMPDQVTVQLNYADAALTGETTVFTCDENANFSINIKNSQEYIITGFTASDGSTPSYYQTSAYCYPQDGVTYTMTVASKESLRTGSFTLKIDNPSKVALRYGSDEINTASLKGDNEPNTIKYNPETEQYLQIGPKNYGETLYKVSLDGVDQPAMYGSYSLTLSEGCVVAIEANFPDLPCTVKISNATAEAAGFITSVKLNDKEVDFASGEITAKLGDKLELTANTEAYSLNSLTVNGTANTYVYWPWSTTLTGDTEIIVDATLKGMIDFVLNIDDPNNVYVWHSQYQGSTGDALKGLVAGDNNLEVADDNAFLTLAPQGGCSIVSVLDADGNNLGTSAIIVRKGMKIYVTTDRIKLDETATLWIDDTSVANYIGATLEVGNDRISYDGKLKTGDNTIEFSEQYNKLLVSWYVDPSNNPVNKLTLNGEIQNPMYEGSNSYEIYLQPGDVIKVFLVSDPAGVESIVADGTGADAPVYNMSGVMVGRLGDAASLPAGLYICDGKEDSGEINHLSYTLHTLQMWAPVRPHLQV